MIKKQEIERSFKVPEEILLPKSEKRVKKPEKESVEKEIGAKDKKIDSEDPKKSIYVKKTVQALPVEEKKEKSKVHQDLESVLSDGLEEIYVSLNEEEKKEFRIKGEETAFKIEELVVNFKAKAREVFKLIKDWLLIIPKVNKHFLEQESKLRTDKVIVLAKKYKKENKR